VNGRARLSAWLVLIVLVLLLADVAPAYADDDGSYVSLGTDWVAKYAATSSPAAKYGDRESAKSCCEGLSAIVSDPATSWRWQFNWGNAAAWELDWKRPGLGGNASRLCDDVDLVAFSGHGLGNDLQFSTQNRDWEATPSDMDLGARDAEWALMFTCNFLNGDPSRYGAAANGVHLICGYATDMTITSNGGDVFADYAKPYGSRQAYGVRVAWYKYGQLTQKATDYNVARTFGAKTAVNDYLWGYGTASADPPDYGSATADRYAYWDTKLNW
jgi:hypothetical protein